MYLPKGSRKGNKEGEFAERQTIKEPGGIEGFLVFGFHLRRFFDIRLCN
jgi:hypothetical protein